MAFTGRDVLQVRTGLGLGQIQFAQLLGVHPITVSKWERGISAPTPYQEAFIESFRQAAQDKAVRERVGKLLVKAGIIAVMFLLLKAAARERRKS